MKAFRQQLWEARAAIKKYEDKRRAEAPGGLVLLKPSDLCGPRSPYVRLGRIIQKAVRTNLQRGTITLLFDYPYEIDLNRIETPLHLLEWVLHLMTKNWMEKDCIEQFITAVCKAKGWNVRGLHTEPP